MDDEQKKTEEQLKELDEQYKNQMLGSQPAVKSSSPVETQAQTSTNTEPTVATQIPPQSQSLTPSSTSTNEDTTTQTTVAENPKAPETSPSTSDSAGFSSNPRADSTADPAADPSAAFKAKLAAKKATEQPEPEPEEATEVKRKSNKMLKRIFILFGFLGLLAIIIAGALSFVRNRNPQPDNEVLIEELAKQSGTKIYTSKKITINGTVVEAEIADSPTTRTQGLMYRDSLENGKGMIFSFGNEAIYSFWMKNMRFPIDIIWINSNFEIISINSNVPPCDQPECPTYSPETAAKYVLEVPAGWASSNGIGAGDTVIIEGENDIEPEATEEAGIETEN